MCHSEGLYQIDLLNGSKERVSDREYWAQKKGQAALDERNAPMIAGGIAPRTTKFETDKAKLRRTIRDALSKATSLDEFSSLLLREGVTVNESRGRLSYLTPDRSKPITARKLGDDFDRTAVLSMLEQNAARAAEKAAAIPEYPASIKERLQRTKPAKSAPKNDGVHRMVDIAAKKAEGKGRGYEKWATMHNLKQMAATLAAYQQYGFSSPEELDEFPEGKGLFGRDRHPAECDCQRAEREKREAAEKRRTHLEAVERLKQRGFTNPAMREWTFDNDNGKCPQMKHARSYVECWEQMKAENIGLLLWGKVGTGKSYFAGCIANALMEREIAVCMTNFALILNDLAASFKDRNEYISRLCSFPLLILDDFGMERGTEYGLEQVYNVIDSRYRSNKPLIVTTNLTLEELQHPEDTAHARIYDRLLEMCSPVRFTGENFRKATAQEKMKRLKTLLNGKESRL